MIEITGVDMEIYLYISLILISYIAIIVGCAILTMKDKSKIAIAVLSISTIVYLVIFPFNKKQSIDGKSFMEIKHEDYALYHKNGEYGAVNRITGEVYSTTINDYVRYELCYSNNLYSMYLEEVYYSSVLSFRIIGDVKHIGVICNKEDI